MNRVASLSTKAVTGAAIGWLAVATGVGVSGVLATLHPPAPQLLLLGITAAFLIVVLGTPAVRAWALAVDERLLVAFHLTRFVGFDFLALYGRGELPHRFAVFGGWGDIAVATLAIALLATGPAAGWRRRAFAAWNALGFIDIVFVVVTAAQSARADPASMRPLQEFPLNLLLTFVVPVIIVTHLVLGYRFAARGFERQPLGRVAGLLALVAVVVLFPHGALPPGAALAGETSSKKPAASPQKDGAQVEEALRAYERLVRLKDSRGLSAMYAPDGELLEPGMEPLKGPEAIRKFFESFAAVEIESASMTADTIEACQDQALQWGHYAQRVIAPGQPAADYTGRFVLEWSRQANGAWLVRRLLVQPSPPPPSGATSR